MATLKYRKNASSPWETLKALPQTGTVRYDLAQSLDTTQQRMARSNIGAAASTDIPANSVSYNAQSGFTNLQREQACENIGAVTYLMDQILNDTEKAQARKNIGAASATNTITITEKLIQTGTWGETGSLNYYMTTPITEAGVYIFFITLPPTYMSGGIGWFPATLETGFTKLYNISKQDDGPSYFQYIYRLPANVRPGVNIVTHGATTSGFTIRTAAIKICD